MNIYGEVPYGEQMYQRIVVVLNDLLESRRAFDSAIELAAAMRATLTTISVVGHLPTYTSYATVVEPLASQELEESRRRHQQAAHEETRAQAHERGLKTESMIIAEHGVKAVVDFLRDHQAGLLVFRSAPT